MNKVHGVYLPDGDTHFARMMNKAPRQLLDGQPVGVYQYAKLEAALSHVKSFRLALDIGAHVGFWSMWLERKFDSVHAFEPSQLHAKCWRQNVKSAVLHECALGSETGSAGISGDPGNTGKTYIDGAGSVDVLRLDDFDFQNVDFVKIDVEGYEAAVIDGGAETLLRDRPIIIVESNGQHDRYGLEDPVKCLEKMGACVIDALGKDFVLGWLC